VPVLPLPHGVFELPAFILGEAAALSFGAMAILALREFLWRLPVCFAVANLAKASALLPSICSSIPYGLWN